jgi:hypothetical protein
MNYLQFLQKLSETPRDWYFDVQGRIRRFQAGAGDGCQCPISALTLKTDQHQVMNEVLRLGLDRELGHQITEAADEFYGFDPKIRADLVDACGLTEY